MNTSYYTITAQSLSLVFPLGEVPVPIISEGAGGLISAKSE
jgi:hypothetical protein